MAALVCTCRFRPHSAPTPPCMFREVNNEQLHKYHKYQFGMSMEALIIVKTHKLIKMINKSYTCKHFGAFVCCCSWSSENCTSWVQAQINGVSIINQLQTLQ